MDSAGETLVQELATGAAASSAPVGHTSGRIATPPICSSHIDRRSEPPGRPSHRADVDSDKLSFKVTADNTPKARIDPPRPGMFEDSHANDAVVARLTFAHATAGKWELVLLSQADAKLAMGAFRRVLGYENVEVTLKLKGEPG